MKPEKNLLKFLCTLQPDEFKTLNKEMEMYLEAACDFNKESLKDKENSNYVSKVKEQIEREQYELLIVHKFKELQARLKEAEDVLSFYSSRDSLAGRFKSKWETPMKWYEDCEYYVDPQDTPLMQDAGKKAREYFEKYIRDNNE